MGIVANNEVDIIDSLGSILELGLQRFEEVIIFYGALRFFVIDFVL